MIGSFGFEVVLHESGRACLDDKAIDRAVSVDDSYASLMANQTLDIVTTGTGTYDIFILAVMV